MLRHWRPILSLKTSSTFSNSQRGLKRSTGSGALLSNVYPSLPQSQPSFGVSSKDVRILSKPSEFYQTLLSMIRGAKKRIFLSTLYIGTEEKELIQTLHDAMTSNPSLSLSVLLDLRRCTRPGPSTADMLLPLLRSFPERAEVFMFKSPKLKGLMEKLVPRRFDEGWGTWHAKVYGVDNEVMFSGANLNTSYFTDRQDRYLHFLNQQKLADYCVAFLRLFSRFSYRLIPSTSEPYNVSWSDSQFREHNFETDAENSIRVFQSEQIAGADADGTPGAGDGETSSDHDTMLFPVIQSGPFNIREEEEALTQLIRWAAEEDSLLDLTSGYFALHQPYQDALLRDKLLCRIVAAGPKANGFYGSKGISGRIPEGYTLFEKRFWRKVEQAGLDKDRISLSEWEKDGWTYHAKGMWLWRASKKTRSLSLDDFPQAGPSLTLFGSTNLNSRSAHLDTELSFLMVTQSDRLRHSLREEVMRLQADATRVDTDTWEAWDRRVRLGTKALIAVMGGML